MIRLDFLSSGGYVMGKVVVLRNGEEKTVGLLGIMEDGEQLNRRAMLLCMGALSAHHAQAAEARKDGKVIAVAGLPVEV